MRCPGWKIAWTVVLAVVGLLAVAQLVPYGRDHTNPPVVAEPRWDRPATRELARRACFDCHSNETRWPWYSHVAPASWLVQNDVDEGRYELNFSRWDRVYEEAHESGDVVREGGMPPRYYLWMHGDAKLTAAEREELARGLDASLAPPRTSRRD